jgi:nitric oxide synthase oxygenase domain/subunit
MHLIFLIIRLQLSLFMPDTTKQITANQLIGFIGLPMTQQTLFVQGDFTIASTEDKETYFPLMIDYTLQHPERFSLFGITIDELHIKLDEENKIVAVFAKLDNLDLVKKMEKEIGEEYMASGVSVGADPVADSHFIWDYKRGCVSLDLNANKVQFRPKIVRDYGLIIFNNCDMLSYITVPKE